MQLQSMIVTGFKSFPQAKLEFPRGITAFVGPNGAGKSNVVDAILWVLGEQSTKALRSEKMEDVIFNGTETRKALSMAEVSLVLTEVTGKELEALAPVLDELPGTKELMVTRRLFRDGESEYFINKIPCRLKDIRGLFLEARAGTRGHTVIEQGNIDQILNSSPQERRGFIEETAGIGRYKKQKSEAVRKLQSTEQNLLRVRDIIAEVKRQLRGLERQARQAEEYQRLREESRTLEIQLLKVDYGELQKKRGEIDEALAECEMRESRQMAEEGRVMACHEHTKEAVLRDGDSVSQRQGDLRAVDQEMGQALTTLEVQRNQLLMYGEQLAQAKEGTTQLLEASQQAQNASAELQDKIVQAEHDIEDQSTLLEEIEEKGRELFTSRSTTQQNLEASRQRNIEIAIECTNAENQKRSLKEQLLSLTQRSERLREEDREFQGQLDHLLLELRDQQNQQQELTHSLNETRDLQAKEQEAIQSLEFELHTADAKLVSYQSDHAAAESRLEALQTVLLEEFGYAREGDPESPTIRRDCQGVLEAIAERLEVPQEFEQAIEAILGEKVRAWVVQDIESAQEAISFSKASNLGRATFVPVHPYRLGGEEDVNSQEPLWWADLKHHDGIVGRALDVIRVPEDLRSAWSCFLDRVVIVRTMGVALELIAQKAWPESKAPLFVSLDGEVINVFGVISGGSSGDSMGMLRRCREIRELELQLESLSRILGENHQKRQSLGIECEAAKSRAFAFDEVIKESELRSVLIEKEILRLNQKIENLESKIQTVHHDQSLAQEGLVRTQREIDSAQSRLSELDREKSQCERELQELNQVFEEMERQSAEVQNRITDARLTLATLRERLDRHQGDVSRLQQEESDRQSQLQGLDQKMNTLIDQSRQSQHEQDQLEQILRELEVKKDAIQSELVLVEERHAEGLMKTKELEQELASIRKSFSETREERSTAEVRLAEVRTRVETLEETLRGTYELMPEEVFAENSGNTLCEVEEISEERLIEWRERLQVIRNRIERIGPINLVAIEEHRELEERYSFLSKQEQDLSESIGSLQEIIQRLNKKTHHLFEETFQALQEKFNEVFSALFAGGKAELILVKPEEDGESDGGREDPGVDIVAQPPGKRLKNLAMLSGGEKTLTVLALMFASFLIKPSPFCILDEVDAPLDEPNVLRFARFLSQMSEKSQFIVITHNKGTMEISDSLFGVTMEEAGVSKFVSVRLTELERVSG